MFAMWVLMGIIAVAMFALMLLAPRIAAHKGK
jgi:Tfp pilus assembly protein PilX